MTISFFEGKKYMSKLAKKSNRKLYLKYTILFAVTSILCFSFFAVYKKAMIWQPDGLYQHYNCFVYFGQWLRTILRNVFIDHNLVIPMWEWGFGMGGDMIGSQTLYDPFYILSVFFPTKFSEIGYEFIIILKMYLVGFVFCAYCRYMKCVEWSTVCGALVYTFCAFTIYAAPRHPFFVNYMIYLPLIFIGCEKIIEKKSFVTYTLAIALAAAFSFYFFYMAGVFTVIYVLLRLLCDSELRKPKAFFATLLKFAGFTVIGVLIALIMLLPVVMNFIANNTRLSAFYEYSFLYSADDYAAMPGGFVNYGGAVTDWAFIGMAPIAFVAVVGSFIKRDKKIKWARVYLIIECAFLLLPIAGRILNGFGYVTNRWTFFWPFIPAFLLAKELPDIFEFERKKKIRIVGVCLAYTLLCMLLRLSRTKYTLVGLVFLLLCVIFVCFADEIKSVKSVKLFKWKTTGTVVVRGTAIAMSVIFAFSFSYFRYNKHELNFTRQFASQNKALPSLRNNRTTVLSLIDDDEFYRVDNADVEKPYQNYPFYFGKSSTNMFWSIMNINEIEFRRLNSDYNQSNFSFSGLYSRAWLQPLFCAKYFVADDSDSSKASVPYGFSYVGTKSGYKGKNYHLYKTDNALPFGYAYDNVISSSDFEKMSLTQRQQAMLQSCVVDDDTASAFDKGNVKFDDYNIAYNLNCDKNIVKSGNDYRAEKSKSTITLTLDGDTIGELYVLLSGLSYAADKDAKNPPESVSIYAECNDAKVNITHFNSIHRYAEGRTEYLINLGYSKEKRDKITLTLSAAGTYSLQNIDVICQPMDKLTEYVTDRKECVLNNVDFSANTITGTVDTDKTRLMCLSLPYTNGWTAYVDGKETDIIKANTILSGLKLTPGHHEIKLVFCTPYLKIGAALSIFGVIMLVCGVIIGRFRRRRKNINVDMVCEGK